MGHYRTAGYQLPQDLCRSIVDPQHSLEIQRQRRRRSLTGFLELVQRLRFETTIDSQEGTFLGCDPCDSKSHDA